MLVKWFHCKSFACHVWYSRLFSCSELFELFVVPFRSRQKPCWLHPGSSGRWVRIPPRLQETWHGGAYFLLFCIIMTSKNIKSHSYLKKTASLSSMLIHLRQLVFCFATFLFSLILFKSLKYLFIGMWKYPMKQSGYSFSSCICVWNSPLPSCSLITFMGCTHHILLGLSPPQQHSGPKKNDTQYTARWKQSSFDPVYFCEIS